MNDENEFTKDDLIKVRKPTMRPEIRAHNLISLTKELILIMEQENEVLKRPTAGALDPLVKQKDALFRLFDAETQFLQENPNFTASIPAELQNELRQTAEKFDEITKKNERALRIGLKVSRQVTDHIVNAARKIKGNVNAYNKKGAMVKPQSAAPITVSQEL